MKSCEDTADQRMQQTSRKVSFMEQRTLGNSGLKVSLTGLGLIPLVYVVFGQPRLAS